MSGRRLPGWATSPVLFVGLALLVRFAFVLSMGNRFYFADTAEYVEAALRLMSGQGPGVDSPRAPLFPAEMALGFLIGGRENFFAVRMLQLALAAALSLIVMHVAGRIGGRAAAALAGLALAFSPTLVFTAGMLYPTLLYATLLTAAIALALAAEERPRALHGAGIGVLVALAYLTDPVAIAPAGALLAWLSIGARRHGAATVRVLGAAAVALVLVLGPYLSWQRAAYGGKAVFMQKAQYVLHYSRTDSTLAGNRRVRLGADVEYRPLATGAFVRHEWDLLRSQPAAYLHDVGAEFLHFFQPLPDRIQTQNQYNRGPVLWIGAIYFTPVLLLAIAGLFLGAGAARRRWALALVVLATACFYSLFFTQTRYRIPVEPALVVLASLGLTRLWPALAKMAGEDGERR